MHQMVMVNSKRWRESETIKFVQLYEQAECLWNVRHPHYKIRTAREKASLHIIEQMNMPDFGMSELKTKIKNIRSTYQQEVNKMKKSKLSLAGAVIEEYKTNLAWFPVADRFLSKVINNVFKNNQVSESNSESIGFQMEPVAYGHLQDEPEDFSSFTVNLEDIKQEIDIDEYSHDISSVQFEPEETVKKEKEGRGKKRKANGEMSPGPVIMDSESLQDEWYHFGHNVACQLRHLPLERALECEQKILEILKQERINHVKSLGEENKTVL